MLKFLLAHYRVVLSVCLLVGFGIILTPSSPANSAGAGEWDGPAVEKEVRPTSVSERELQARSEEIRRSIEVKESILMDLLAARVTLEEATEQFLMLTKHRAGQMQIIRTTFEGNTDQEKMARNIIQAIQLRTEPEKRDAVRIRLERELRQMLTGSAAE